MIQSNVQQVVVKPLEQVTQIFIEEESYSIVSEKVVSVEGGYIEHNHDDLYYRQEQVENKLAEKLSINSIIDGGTFF